mmetsp:Transcript_27517/g.33696  ORF Transcript_27517/g.33696 Transcript_27517/m.33696 type:complete len:377 (-) Transcript_27517:169-1299(-)
MVSTVDMMINVLNVLVISTQIVAAQQNMERTLPSHYFIFGDKFSGIAYLEELFIVNNISEAVSKCSLLDGSKSNGQSKAKHIKDIEDVNMAAQWRHEPFILTDIKTLNCTVENTLFILVTKDPYAWLVSVLRKKLQTNSLLKTHMKSFLSGNWDGDRHIFGKSFKRRNRYRNVMEKRTETLKSHSRILQKVPHNAIIRYEDLVEDLDGTLRELFRGRGVRITKKRFKDVSVPDHVKRRFYLDRSFLNAFDSKAIRRSTRFLDKNIESKFGYNVPPLDGDWLREEEVRRRKRTKNRGYFGRLWFYIMDILSWIVISTLCFIVLLYSALTMGFVPKKVSWQETSDTNGSTYYYHPITREVSWFKPRETDETDAKNKSN